jgi:hypothetical protein
MARDRPIRRGGAAKEEEAMTRKVKIAITTPLALVAVLALLAAVGLVAGCGSSADRSSGTSSLDAARTSDQAATASVPEPVMGADAGTASKSTSGGAAEGQDFAAAIPSASAPSSHYLLRTGDLSLLVGRGTLPSTVDRIKSMTTAMGGYVMSSAVGSQSGGVGPVEPMPLNDTAVSSEGGAKSTSSDTLSDPYATLVVRVPEQLFETAIKRLSKLGDVQNVTTSSEDVTSQYVDLQARLRHYRAVERRLVGFLQETTTVNQMLVVQDRIDQVQLTIEQLSAQLKSLGETTTYGTLSVFVSEKDATPATIHASNTFGGTLSNSIHLLGRGVRVAALVLTALVPFIVVFGVVGVVVWYVVRRVRRSRRQAAQPSLPA